jgi:hypothetical protein
MKRADFEKNWKEIASGFLKLGATAYGGPAIMGIMQAEVQEKRQWVSKERFVEGLSLANFVPGATATQIGMFLGYARGGWWGGLLAGLCFGNDQVRLGSAGRVRIYAKELFYICLALPCACHSLLTSVAFE